MKIIVFYDVPHVDLSLPNGFPALSHLLFLLLTRSFFVLPMQSNKSPDLLHITQAKKITFPYYSMGVLKFWTVVIHGHRLLKTVSTVNRL